MPFSITHSLMSNDAQKNNAQQQQQLQQQQPQQQQQFVMTTTMPQYRPKQVSNLGSVTMAPGSGTTVQDSTPSIAMSPLTLTPSSDHDGQNVSIEPLDGKEKEGEKEKEEEEMKKPVTQAVQLAKVQLVDANSDELQRPQKRFRAVVLHEPEQDMESGHSSSGGSNQSSDIEGNDEDSTRIGSSASSLSADESAVLSALVAVAAASPHSRDDSYKVKRKRRRGSAKDLKVNVTPSAQTPLSLTTSPNTSRPSTTFHSRASTPVSIITPDAATTTTSSSSTSTSTSASWSSSTFAVGKAVSFSKANITRHAREMTTNNKGEPIMHYHPNSFAHRKKEKPTKKKSSSSKVKEDEIKEQDVDDNGPNGASGNRSRYCRPCPLVLNLPPLPLQTLYMQVQRQYTMSKKELEKRNMSTAAREELVSVPLRIMGSSQDLNQLYFVAKDVCVLVFIRKGNVAKSIGQFLPTEKARLPVLCPRSNGSSSTHVLTALTLDGVRRLLTHHKSPLATQLLQFIQQHVDMLKKTVKEGKVKIDAADMKTHTNKKGKARKGVDENDDGSDMTDDDGDVEDASENGNGNGGDDLPLAFPLPSQLPSNFGHDTQSSSDASSSSSSASSRLFHHAVITPKGLTLTLEK